ncbi:MAG: hypothetical protein A2033_00635 [Bacteroidetes bacterium GWA2_31_9]|nr:MAG: hypothetical protein A2033_00635 [Bacteroidetes bacterium GWA2_31_9]
MDKKELKALISLLDDNDESVFEVVNKKLLELGNEVIPELEIAWEQSINEGFQEKVENIIQSIQFQLVKDSLKELVASDDFDLLKGAYWISRYQYPDLDFEKISQKIEVIKKDIWLELNNNLTALEKVKILNHIIYDVHGFSRNSSNFYAPQNSYINYLLDEKKGNAVSLSLLYAIISQQLDLPIYGVNLPKNFVLAYKDEIRTFSTFQENDSDNVLFYINPFNKGAVFGRREIDLFIKQQNLVYSESYFVACNNKSFIIELVNSLIISYEKLGYPDKVQDFHEILNILMS